jgi:arginyl-tRNA synthetase
MATDLFADITAQIAGPLDEALVAAGADPGVELAPPTRDGAGDLALACHRYARVFRKAPQAIADDLAESLKGHPLVAGIDSTAGFLNLQLDWTAVAQKTLEWAASDEGALGRSDVLHGQKIVVEYSSPNTNKPLHLGHCRNNILGANVSALLRAAGADVVRVNLINDRGIHICKSMVAYRRDGDGVTPESSGKKGDHLVGEFYVRFDQLFSAEHRAWSEVNGEELSKDDFFNSDHSDIGRETRAMLLAWEAGDEDVRALWRMMNGWCEAGFNATYQRMGVGFERIYRESETYLLGKDLIAQGLETGVFSYASNGAVVFDLEPIGLEGEKAVLRADGTSVYVTQDIGTAVRRFEELEFDRMIYVVGNEQNHHFKVLFGILETLRPELKERLHHLSYGMVELPDGKMKSREGTVIDADDFMDELRDAAADAGRSRWPDLDDASLLERAEDIALGGLKFFLLKYAPPTNFVFDRERSISIEGETGAYCQYAFARASSILRKLDGADDGIEPDYRALDNEQGRAVLRAMLAYPGEASSAALELKPSLVTKACYTLAKTFATFYNHPECRVIGAEPGAMAARAALVRAARRMLGGALNLLGMSALDEM